MPEIAPVNLDAEGGRSAHDAEGAQFVVGGLAGADVGERVVGVVEGLLEQLAVQLGQIGVLETVGARQRAERRSFRKGGRRRCLT